MNECSIVLAALLVVSAAGVGAAEGDGAAEYVIGQKLIGEGRLADAEAAPCRGLAIDEASDRGSSDASHRAREASTLDVLASLAIVRGDSREAEVLLRRALVLSETAPRLPDVEVARILSSLATLLADRGSLREAECLASRARKMYEKMRGPQHAELAEVLVTLAAVRGSRGDLDEAQAAAFYARQGKDGTAEHLFVRALAALERLEARDPRRAAVLQRLASLYAKQGRRAEAARIESTLAAPRAMLSRGFTVPAAEEP